MAKNLKFKAGRHLQLVKASKAAGDMAAWSQLVGVCLTASEATTNYVTVDTEGVYNLPVRAHNGSAGANVAVGDKVYLTDGEAFLDVDSAAVLFGYALSSAASTAYSGTTYLTMPVKLR